MESLFANIYENIFEYFEVSFFSQSSRDSCITRTLNLCTPRTEEPRLSCMMRVISQRAPLISEPSGSERVAPSNILSFSVCLLCFAAPVVNGLLWAYHRHSFKHRKWATQTHPSKVTLSLPRPLKMNYIKQ